MNRQPTNQGCQVSFVFQALLICLCAAVQWTYPHELLCSYRYISILDGVSLMLWFSPYAFSYFTNRRASLSIRRNTNTCKNTLINQPKQPIEPTPQLSGFIVHCITTFELMSPGIDSSKPSGGLSACCRSNSARRCRSCARPLPQLPPGFGEGGVFLQLFLLR